MTKNMLPVDAQRAIEYTYSKKYIDRYIKKEIQSNTDLMEKHRQGVSLVSEWLQDNYYESKNKRLEQIKDIDLNGLVMDVFVGTAWCQVPELFTSITAQLAGKLGFDDKRDSILTIAEIVALLAYTDVYDLIKESISAPIVIKSNIPLSNTLIQYVEQASYLPPMVCEPRDITHNYESGYLTQNDCMVLGKKNGHDGDLCLDVINIQNKVPLKLDQAFLLTVEEEPTFALDSADKIRNWNQFKKESNQRYSLMFCNGNHFYLTNKVDTRGRMYAQGYHINTQGTSYKKAMIEFVEEELIDGVPTS